MELIDLLNISQIQGTRNKAFSLFLLKFIKIYLTVNIRLGFYDFTLDNFNGVLFLPSGSWVISGRRNQFCLPIGKLDCEILKIATGF